MGGRRVEEPKQIAGAKHAGKSREHPFLTAYAEYLRAELERATEHLDRAVALFGELPPSADKAQAYSELAGNTGCPLSSASCTLSSRSCTLLVAKGGSVEAVLMTTTWSRRCSVWNAW